MVHLEATKCGEEQSYVGTGKVYCSELGGSAGQLDVRQIDSEASVTIELRVAPDDMGKVIGKQGRIAKAIRTVVRAATLKDDKPVYVEII